MDPETVGAIKERLFAPTRRTEGILPSDIMNEFGRMISLTKYSINKTEETMLECLEKVEELKEEFEAQCYVPQGDAHYLAKANEVRSTLLIMDVIMKACMARKESRAAAIRADYPQRDDKNMLKWVIVSRGEDGKAAVRYERIPFERYRFKPEGWTMDAAE